jgi:hypothetical protein
MTDITKITGRDEENIEPSQRAKVFAKYFELQLSDAAIQAYEKKDYVKSAMLSWSYVEEFFLPTSIELIAKRQKISLDEELLNRANSYQLIRYYFLISYDRDMFNILEKARKLRNKMTHQIYKSKSLSEVEKRAQESAKYNLLTAFEPMFDRQEGKVVAPSLKIYFDARNDLRKEMKQKLKLYRAQRL